MSSAIFSNRRPRWILLGVSALLASSVTVHQLFHIAMTLSLEIMVVFLIAEVSGQVLLFTIVSKATQHFQKSSGVPVIKPVITVVVSGYLVTVWVMVCVLQCLKLFGVPLLTNLRVIDIVWLAVNVLGTFGVLQLSKWRNQPILVNVLAAGFGIQFILILLFKIG